MFHKENRRIAILSIALLALIIISAAMAYVVSYMVAGDHVSIIDKLPMLTLHIIIGPLHPFFVTPLNQYNVGGIAFVLIMASIPVYFFYRGFRYEKIISISIAIMVWAAEGYLFSVAAYI